MGLPQFKQALKRFAEPIQYLVCIPSLNNGISIYIIDKTLDINATVSPQSKPIFNTIDGVQFQVDIVVHIDINYISQPKKYDRILYRNKEYQVNMLVANKSNYHRLECTEYLNASEYSVVGGI